MKAGISERIREGFVALVAAGSLTLAASVAHATVITGTSTFTQADAALGGGAGTFGTLGISLDNTAGTATFTFTGANGYEFVDSHVADLNLLVGQNATITSSTLSPGGETLSSTGSNEVNSFGIFTYTTKLGNSATPQTSISFTLSSSDFFGLTSISQLLALNADGWDAAAHMCRVAAGATTCGSNPTGFVAEGTGIPAPEPASFLLLGTGLIGLGVLSRRLRWAAPS